MARTKQTARTCARTSRLPLATAGPNGNANREIGMKRPKQQPSKEVPKKKKRGVKALNEIRTLQRSAKPIIPKAPFVRLMRDCARELLDEDEEQKTKKFENLKGSVRFTEESIIPIMDTAEAYLLGILQDMQLLAIHGKRVTVMDKDLNLAKRLRKDPNN